MTSLAHRGLVHLGMDVSRDWIDPILSTTPVCQSSVPSKRPDQAFLSAFMQQQQAGAAVAHIEGLALVVHPLGRRVGPSMSIYREPLVIAGGRSNQARASARPRG